MKTVKVLATVDEQRRLSAEVPASVPPGPVEILVVVPTGDEDEAGAAWAEGIAREWAAELNDPREDVYTLEDGEPVDGAQ